MKTVHSTQGRSELLDKADSWITKYSSIFLWAAMLLTTIFTLLMMDIKVSTGGDDATYILRAYDFIHHFFYPSFQGPLYPIILSPFILIFGINLLVLKALSFLFLLGFMYFFYKLFIGKVPSVILISALIISSVCGLLLYYGIQTYSETFFMFLQILLFYVFFKYFINREVQKLSLKENYRAYLLLGFMIFVSSLARSIGYATIIAVILYFILKKQWKPVLWIIISFLLFTLTFSALRTIIWHTNQIQFQSQALTLFLKHPYNPEYGNENVAGFIKRFYDNSQSYLSKDLYIFLGLTSESSKPFILLSIIAFLLFILAFYHAFRRNRYLLFTGIYLLLMIGITFIILQNLWHQYRLIVIFLPWILLFCFSGIYFLTKSKMLRKLQFLPIILMICLFLTSFSRTVHLSVLNMPALKAYIMGNNLYGYTPDWINYIKISQWASKNIPQDKVIGCRKASVSFIHTNGRYFASIDKVPSTNLKSYLDKLSTLRGKYIIINEDDLGKIPSTGRFTIDLIQSTDALLQSITYDQTGIGFHTYNFRVYLLPDSLSDVLKFGLSDYGIPFETDIDILFNKLRNEVKDYLVYEPDQLLGNLRNRKIDYLILASLRRNPNQKTNITINTVERYVSFIQSKYPNLFRKIHQIGSEDDEPAAVIEILYNSISGNK
ncbi:MAG: hypothetical protein NT175_09935 [Bacteroidetes bacterium]|nr:hypothetical protein [Bacteroidota bacterium]